MTDTTNTGGKMCSLGINAPQPLNITFTDGSQLIFPLSGKASFTGDVEESARVFFNAVIRQRDSQLEAERQRAEAAEKERDEAIDERDGIHKLAMETIAELRSKLDNPVVLPDLASGTIQLTHPFNLFDVIVATQIADTKAIHAAGFPVKGE